MGLYFSYRIRTFITRYWGAKEEKVNKSAVGIYVIAVLSVSGFAQTINISGKVTNTSGQPLEAAVVKIFAVPDSCTTKADGTYLLSGYTNTLGMNLVQLGLNSIKYQNHSFIFTVSAPASATLKFYDCADA